MSTDLAFSTIDDLLARHASQLANTSPGTRRLSLWRGQTADWPLLPSGHRPSSPWPPRRLRSLIADFGRENAPYLAAVDHQPEWEVAAIAQHVGVPTSLLDWSLSPRIALWFAVADDHEQSDADGVLWWACSQDAVSTLGEDGYGFPDDPFALRPAGRQPYEVYLSRARHPRITAQRGCFVAWADPDQPFDTFMAAYDGGPNRAPRLLLIRIPIPATDKPRLRAMLRADGLDERILLPDPDGLSAWTKAWLHAQHP